MNSLRLWSLLWSDCEQVALLGGGSTSNAAAAAAWRVQIVATDHWEDIGFCAPSIDVDGPWAGFQTGKAWLFRSAGADSGGLMRCGQVQSDAYY